MSYESNDETQVEFINVIRATNRNTSIERWFSKSWG